MNKSKRKQEQGRWNLQLICEGEDKIEDQIRLKEEGGSSTRVCKGEKKIIGKKWLIELNWEDKWKNKVISRRKETNKENKRTKQKENCIGKKKRDDERGEKKGTK